MLCLAVATLFLRGQARVGTPRAAVKRQQQPGDNNNSKDDGESNINIVLLVTRIGLVLGGKNADVACNSHAAELHTGLSAKEHPAVLLHVSYVLRNESLLEPAPQPRQE